MRAALEKYIKVMLKNRMKMDSNLFETIKNGKFGLFYIK
jgi:hypothetical protein